MAKSTKQDFSNPLVAGLEYLRLKEEKGISVPDIAKQFRVSIPAVYKYIQLAECDKRIHNYIVKGDITATKVVSILHTSPKADLLAAVTVEVKERKKKLKRLEKDGLTKMTMKRRVQDVTREIEAKHLNSPKAQFLKEIAQHLTSGASVEKLLSLV